MSTTGRSTGRSPGNQPIESPPIDSSQRGSRSSRSRPIGSAERCRCARLVLYRRSTPYATAAATRRTRRAGTCGTLDGCWAASWPRRWVARSRRSANGRAGDRIVGRSSCTAGVGRACRAALGCVRAPDQVDQLGEVGPMPRPGRGDEFSSSITEPRSSARSGGSAGRCPCRWSANEPAVVARCREQPATAMTRRYSSDVALGAALEWLFSGW